MKHHTFTTGERPEWSYADSEADITDEWVEITGDTEASATAFFKHDYEATEDYFGRGYIETTPSIAGLVVNELGMTYYVERDQARVMLGDAFDRIEQAEFELISENS